MYVHSDWHANNAIVIRRAVDVVQTVMVRVRVRSVRRDLRIGHGLSLAGGRGAHPRRARA